MTAVYVTLISSQERIRLSSYSHSGQQRYHWVQQRLKPYWERGPMSIWLMCRNILAASMLDEMDHSSKGAPSVTGTCWVLGLSSMFMATALVCASDCTQTHANGLPEVVRCLCVLSVADTCF
ncbi:hypothetical protein ARMSODRAFT_440439 [Armillaria solidipes]|uniref:Uncharacterized protein n=1 Tax=Armillaria solidipes TaxID=1076256 RepID=A0A2H3B8T8_9AGAR|nr:hypothetical protein ARMSODRAFT_440439 [Armillaria solidipes]